MTETSDSSARYTYDSKEGIEHGSSSLVLFNQLIDERHKAGYERGEQLNEFHIFGRFFLDSCGNCCRINGITPKEQFPDIPDVLTNEELRSFLKERMGEKVNISLSWGIGDIPHVGILCPFCKEGWNTSNCHDVSVRKKTAVIALADFKGHTLAEVKKAFAMKDDGVYFMQSDILIRNDRFIDLSPKYPNSEKDWQKGVVVNERGWVSDRDGITDEYVIQVGDEGHFNVWKYYHRECNRLDRAQTECAEFRELFRKAGYEQVDMVAIPNEYSSSEICGPWFNVTTSLGVIKIGWRKRVININWSDLLMKWRGELIHLFDHEEVTKDRESIHAWGYEKAEQYLRKIREYLA